MKAISLIITLLFLSSLGTGVLSQETELPDPGLTPDSPFYFLETIAEAIGTFFTFGDLKKAERHAALAAERLSEARAVVEKGKPEFAEKTLERYEMQLEKSMAMAEKAMTKEKDAEKAMEIVAKAGKTTSRHLEVLAEVYEKVPEEAKPAVENAMKASVKEHEKAVVALKAKNALGDVQEEVSMPAEVPTEVRERIQTRAQQELQIEEVLGGIDMSKSLRDICAEQGGTPEMCEQFPLEKFESFEQIESWCVETGGPQEICSTLESKCREYGVTTPNECFLLISIASVRAYTSTELKAVQAPSLSEEERRKQEEENTGIEYKIAYIGVTSSTINDDIQARRELSVNYGALVLGIIPNGPAATAGLKEDDIILEFQGERITEDNNMTEMLFRSEAGTTVSLKVLRGEAVILINVKLTERPTQDINSIELRADKE